ncbi:hypothetical protein [Haloterrigena alkaliphila]|uniref:DUF8158 domain-containing protein n=1 Tax=Haloterrigena alkaliphila TaxID=2816475 RepID=A0A8A2V9E2_9EURY|nr:hypothetical protein [Haloterrigena alkaliphila]QSW97656.1 hypothetical protein J0X25_09500 [Haloterrigena alkaliphila]
MSFDGDYRVQENTEDPDHPSIDDVVELTLKRATSPRSEDHPGRHFDLYVYDAVDKFGESSVEDCVRLSLTEGLTHRSAGAEAFGADYYVWGINVGVAAGAYLRELLREPNFES